MQGLFDQHMLMHDPDALGVVEKMANYFCQRIARLILEKGLGHWRECLNIEFGGMNEVGWIYNVVISCFLWRILCSSITASCA